MGLLEERREGSERDILTKFLQTLSGLLELYGSSGRLYDQNPECDALVLGKFIRGLTNAGLYPIPEPSSLNSLMQELFLTVREMDLSPLCRKSTRSYYSFSDDGEPFQRYHLDQGLKSSLSSIEVSIEGLSINERSRKDEI